MAENIMTSPWLTPKMAAARIHCCLTIIYRRIRAGELKAYRVGGKLLIKESDLDAMVMAEENIAA